jgi:hypothetical protein
MTANELATVARKAAEKKEKSARRDAAILQARLETESSTWKGKERGVVLISESDGKAANEEEDELAVDQLAEDDIFANFEDEMATLDPIPSPPTALPPVSTAPPALGRGKRQRAHTERYEEGIDACLIGESQHGAIGRPQKKRAE